MKTANNIFIIFYSILGFCALIGAIFFKIYWQLFWVIVCMFMIFMCIRENRNEN